MSSGERIGSSRLTRYFCTCFRVFGLWFDSKYATQLNRVYTVAVCVFYLVYLTCLMTYLFFTIDLEDTVNAMYMAMTILSLFVKIINLVAKNRQIRQCIKQVEDFELYNVEERRLYHKRHTHFARLMIYYYTVCYITGTASGINAVFQGTLPFRGSYPCDWRQGGACYWSVYAYQMIGIMLCIQLNVTLEQFACFVMYEISIQLEIVGNRLEGIGWTNCGSDDQQLADLKSWVKVHKKSMQ